MTKNSSETTLGASSGLPETDLRHGRGWLPTDIPDYYVAQEAVQTPLIDASGRPYIDDSLREAGLKGVVVARFALDNGPNSVPAPNDKL